MESESIKNAFLQDGEAGLEAVMREYGQALLRYCHSILCDYHEAQDALQITFIKAYRKRTLYRSDLPLTPWLYRIAYTTCIDLLRRKRLPTFISLETGGGEARDYIPEQIREALITLSGKERALVYGRVMEDRPYEELSGIFNENAAALRKRYERARKKLLVLLKEEYPHYAKLEESK